MNTGQGDNAHWTTYNDLGNQTGTGTFGTVSNGVAFASFVGSETSAVKYVVFTQDASEHSNGFVVNAVNLNTVGTDTFGYVVTDKDGDADSANLVFTGATAATLPTGLEQMPTSGPLSLHDLLTDSSHTVALAGTTDTTVNILNSAHTVEQTILLLGHSPEQLKSLLNEGNTPTGP